MKRRSKMTKAMKEGLWTLFTWLDILGSKVRIHGLDCPSGELCLQNKAAPFEYNFALDDLPTIKGLSKLCCMWANSSVSAKTDFNGTSIYEIADRGDWGRLNAG